MRFYLKRVIFWVSILNLRSVKYFSNIADKSIKFGSSKAKPKHPFQCKYLIDINTNIQDLCHSENYDLCLLNSLLHHKTITENI